MPTAAEALWSTQVKTIPTRMPSRGLEKVVSRSRKAWLSRRGETEALMVCMPNMSTANPSKMSPTCCFPWLRENIRRRMPTTATTPVRVEVDRRDTQPDPPCRSDRQMIHPVMLVPRMAPRTMPMAWRTFIMPELTKPTTITEVAEEDWMMAVTPVPRSTPFMGLLESLYSTSSSLLPATFFSPSPIRVMPKRKRATPPSSAMRLDKSTVPTLLSLLCSLPGCEARGFDPFRPSS